MKARAVRLHAANDLRLDTFELPEIRDDEILVKVVSDSICMSTYKCAILGTEHKRVHPDVAEHPAIMGHEFAGDIVKVGAKHQDKFKPGMKFTLQPALNYKGTMWSPGYSYEFFGGDATYCIIPAEVMELGCLLEYKGRAYYEASLAEPMSCSIGAFNAAYHTKMGVYHHEMGIKKGGKLALEDVNFHVDDGEFVFLLGHSGAGKSTLLKLLLREELPSEGKVTVLGKDVASLHRHQVPYLRRQMGIIFQDFRLIPTMTVYENIAFAMHVTNVKSREISDRVEYMLELVHLEDKAKAYPDTLSGGEQQRVAVARALAHGPKLVIADEPTGNIDPELSLEMMELLERVSETGITVVVVTHEHELVRQFHQRVVTLKKGRIISDVPADKEAIRARAERKERLFETELEPADTAEKEAATV